MNPEEDHGKFDAENEYWRDQLEIAHKLQKENHLAAIEADVTNIIKTGNMWLIDEGRSVFSFGRVGFKSTLSSMVSVINRVNEETIFLVTQKGHDDLDFSNEPYEIRLKEL